MQEIRGKAYCSPLIYPFVLLLQQFVQVFRSDLIIIDVRLLRVTKQVTEH